MPGAIYMSESRIAMPNDSKCGAKIVQRRHLATAKLSWDYIIDGILIAAAVIA